MKVNLEDTVECTHMFSNGTEYEIFLEGQCFECKRFKKGYCRTYRMTEKARWDEKYFPYDKLLEFKQFAGKLCKDFTRESPPRKKPQRKQCEGQTTLDI